MKKYLLAIITLILAAGCLTGCGAGSAQAAPGTKKLQIVTTIFPEYDWVMNVLGDNPAGAEVTMLLDKGVDADRIAVLGLGNQDPWHIYGIGTECELATQNRKVVMLNLESDDARELMQRWSSQ